MNYLILLVLCVTSGVHSKTDEIDDVQRLILDSINETAPDFQPCNEDLLRQATFADMIEIKRHGYFHWCVFVHGETVIQLNNPEFDRLTVENAFDNFTGHVELRNLMRLAGNDFCRINNKISESKRRELLVLSESDTRKLMKEELNHRVTFYNLVNYNCEHFATKMKFGVPFSSQIEAVKQITQKEDLKETVAQMFEVAASQNSATTSSSLKLLLSSVIG
ncbi:phospholipase A and acyltransferase 5-like [Bradysia coprophila]|uniref:phospholipase A and acyltransferase 5-like n=1 Tax=Bradysia coprophila TaxID=38358 RepID=UPI00187DB4BC|nr:phospholipase A and acyltransferase 5-like [Bradysia coprophila]